MTLIFPYDNVMKRLLTHTILQNSSVLLLVLMNLIPAYGVIFEGWKAFDIVFIYVAETVIIGGLNILKMAFASSLRPGTQYQSSVIVHALKIFMIPFFIIHYFFFLMIQSLFVFAFLKGETIENMFAVPLSFWQILNTNAEIRLCVMGILCSHIFSFLVYYIGNKEYDKIGLPMLMVQPYIRIFIQQFVVIAGVLLMSIYNTPAIFALLLVFLKIIADAVMHLKIHRKYRL